MYHFGIALLFILFVAALIMGGGFIIYMISSLKQDEYFLKELRSKKNER